MLSAVISINEMQQPECLDIMHSKLMIYVDLMEMSALFKQRTFLQDKICERLSFLLADSCVVVDTIHVQIKGNERCPFLYSLCFFSFFFSFFQRFF